MQFFKDNHGLDSRSWRILSSINNDFQALTLLCECYNIYFFKGIFGLAGIGGNEEWNGTLVWEDFFLLATTLISFQESPLVCKMQVLWGVE